MSKENGWKVLSYCLVCFLLVSVPCFSQSNPVNPLEKVSITQLLRSKGGAFPKEIISFDYRQSLRAVDRPDAVELKFQKPNNDTEKQGPILAPNASLIGRIWAFQGYFHPAIAHFPIVLLIVSACSLLLSYVTHKRAEDFAFFCLAVASMTSVVAVVMGWSFATERGHPDWTFVPTDESNDTIYYHRWMGMCVPILSIATLVMAFVGKRWSSIPVRKAWHVGVLVTALFVTWVGHQGGKLAYGEKFFDKAFQRLFESPNSSK